MPATFGLADSISQYSSGACAPAPWPSPNCPAGSLSGAPVNVTPGHDPARRGQSTGSIPALWYVATRNRMLENLTELRAERTHLVEEALDSGGVTVSCDERMKGLDEMPSRAVDLSLITRVNILSGSSSPLRPRRYHLELDDALGS